MTRVFVLGAGVSASCGIPITKDIFGAVMNRLKAKRPEDFKILTRLLRYLYPSFRITEENYPNLEEFFAQVEMARRFNSGEFVASTLWDAKRLERVEKMLKRALARYLWQFTTKATATSIGAVKDFFDRVLQPGDVIITFNWDLTIERANTSVRSGESCDLGYIYEANSSSKESKKRSGVTLLKPHGSIDWFTKKQVDSIRNAGRNDFFEIGPDLFVYNHFDFVKHHHLSRETPVIIAPTPYKEFSVPMFREIWRGVFRSLRDADAVFAIGYSLPREDQFARLVLRRAFRALAARRKREKTSPEITIVNPDASVRERFASAIGPGLYVVFKQMKFERWLQVA